MSRPIKVAEFVTRLEFGGVESVVLRYIENLPNKEDFEIHVVSQNIFDRKCVDLFESTGIKVHFVTHKRQSVLNNFKEIWRILKKEKFDVVHCHMTLTNFYILFMAKVLNVRIRISHSHNAFIAQTNKQKLFWPILKCLNRLFANVWMTCGYDAGEFLFGNLAMKNGDVIILNNAINEKQFEFDVTIRNRLRSERDIDNRFVIGHIGRFTEQKNHTYLVDIFAKVLNIIPDSILLLVGAGELQNRIKEKVNALGIEKSVVFIGNVTNPQDYYQAMDLFVLPSLFEGLPVVSIEAQASGLPCLISDNVDKRCKVTSSVEFIPIDKGDDIWVNKIISYIDKKRNCNALEEIVQHGYSISEEAKKLEKVYRGIK